MFTLRYFLGLLLLGFAAIACAQVVECVDANGKKTYAQSCPNETDQKREIEAPPKLGGNKAPDDSWKDKDREFEKRRQDRLNAEAKQAAQKQKNAQMAAQCETAKRELDALETGKQAKRVDPVTGEHVPMDSDDRQSELDNLHAQIQNNCQ